MNHLTKPIIGRVNFKILSILICALLVSFLHYSTSRSRSFYHELFARYYSPPIFLGGLAIASRIAREHGGTLKLERLHMKGTRVILEIPIIDEMDKQGRQDRVS